MPVYSRTTTTTTTATQTAPQMASRELSSIIVRALENIEDKDDSQQLSQDITKGIDNSLLVKKADSPQDKTSQMLDLLKKNTANDKEEKKQSKKDADKENKENKSLLSKIHTTNVKNHGAVSKKIGDVLTGLTIGTAVGSQILVLLKAGYIYLKETSEANRIKMMAKIHSTLSTIPDKIELAGAKLLSKIKFPGFSFDYGLSKVESEEKDTLQDDIKKLKKLQEKGGIDRNAALMNAQTNVAGLMTGMGKFTEQSDLDALGIGYYDVSNSSPEQWEEYKAKILELGKNRDEQFGNMAGMYDGYDTYTDYLQSYINQIETNMQLLDTEDVGALISQKEARLAELQDMEDNYFDYKAKEIDAKKESSERDYVRTQIEKLASSEGGIKTTTKEELEKSYSGIVSEAKINLENQGKDFRTAELTAGESWLRNEFQDWKNSWSDFGKNLSQNIGIRVVQKQDKSNPLSNR